MSVCKNCEREVDWYEHDDNYKCIANLKEERDCYRSALEDIRLERWEVVSESTGSKQYGSTQGALVAQRALDASSANKPTKVMALVDVREDW